MSRKPAAGFGSLGFDANRGRRQKGARRLLGRLRRVTAIAAGRSRLARLARLWGGGRLPVVLSYHSVAGGDTPPPYVSPSLAIPRPLFRSQLERLSRRHHVVPVQEVYRILRGEAEPRPGMLAVTFDDGYADNVELALPDLLSVGIHATVFVTTGPMMRREPLWTAELGLLLARTACRRLEFEGAALDLETARSRLRAWRELTRAWAVLPPRQVIRHLHELSKRLEVSRGQAKDAVMDASGVKTWTSSGMGLGSHTVHHPNLAYQSADVVREEVADASRDLEAVVGERPHLLAYPNCGGLAKHHDRTTCAVVRSLGFRMAFTSDAGPVMERSDPFALPRVSVSRRLWNVDLLEAELEMTRLRGVRRGRP